MRRARRDDFLCLSCKGAHSPIAIITLLVLWCSPQWAADQRDVQSLNDRWLFQLVNDEAVAPHSTKWTTLSLPHTWNAEDGSQAKRAYSRGIGYYQRSLQIPETWRGRRVFLTIGAANAKAQVSINGQTILEHRTGFTAFTADLTPHLRTTVDQDLQITVDNRHNLDYPPLVSDYTFFGGIYRQAWLTVTDPVHVSLTHHGSSGVYLIQRQVDRGRAEVDAQIELANDLASDVADVVVSVEVLDQTGKAVVTVRSCEFQKFLPESSRNSCRLPEAAVGPVFRKWVGRLSGGPLGTLSPFPLGFTALVPIRRG